jgi:diketogulonate reductase-like aldo/keto reductase
MYCNQPAVGRAIADFMRTSGTDRKDLFVESMLPQWHLGYNETKANFESTLQQLQLDYVDLYMFHWPGLFENNLPMEPSKHVETCGIPVTADPPCKKGERSWKKCRLGSWKAMLELQAAGKIRALGTSNFEIPQLQQLLDATPSSSGQALAVNQVESHLGYHDDYLQAWCAKHKIQQQAYSPLSGGALAKRCRCDVVFLGGWGGG